MTRRMCSFTSIKRHRNDVVSVQTAVAFEGYTKKIAVSKTLQMRHQALIHLTFSLHRRKKSTEIMIFVVVPIHFFL